MRVVIQDNYDKMCKWAANYIADKIRNQLLEKNVVIKDTREGTTFEIR